jgi:nitroreductase
LTGPGPDEATLTAILRLAARVPDHGKIAPWRFVVLEGAGARAYGEKLAALVAARKPETDAGLLAFEAARFARGGVCVAVVSKPVLNAKVPEWEQVLSSAAVCMNMLHAAWGFGYAGCWLTEWPAYDREAMALLGLSAEERIAGFVYLGQASEPPLERPRPHLDTLITRYPAA